VTASLILKWEMTLQNTTGKYYTLKNNIEKNPIFDSTLDLRVPV
jgi:hypothetical protein